MSKCNRCDFEVPADNLCTNCGELNKFPYQYFRVDAQNQIKYWIEQMRSNYVYDAVEFVSRYKKTYPNAPVRIRRVTEEEV
jgi:hypothetical protein